MSDRSPLFMHAIELLIHSVELFQQANERKYVFIVLHLANTVELLLQDRLLDAGHSIYEINKPVALNVFKVLELLKKERVKIPERPFIDLLIEDRDTIQHRFERPELKTIYRYIDDVTGFVKRFLREEFTLDLGDVLRELGQTEENLQLFGVLEGQGNVLAFLDKLFALSPGAAIVQAFNFVEGKFMELSFLQATYFDPRVKESFLRTSHKSAEFTQLLETLVEEKFLTRKVVNQLDQLRSARNYAVYHDAESLNPPDWANALAIAKEVMIGLDNAIESHYASEAEIETHPVEG